MSLAIRLARGGAKKRPYYRIVVADKRRARDGRFIERVGSYNPMLATESSERVILQKERIAYWLSCGAQPSDRVARFLAQANIIPERPIPKQTKQHRAKSQLKAQDSSKTESTEEGTTKSKEGGDASTTASN